MRKILALLVVMVAAASAQQFRVLPDTPAWKSLQTLVGKWDGTVMEEGKLHATHVEVRMTGGGSALLHWIGDALLRGAQSAADEADIGHSGATGV